MRRHAYVLDVELQTALELVPLDADVVGIAFAPERRGGGLAWHVAYSFDVAGDVDEARAARAYRDSAPRARRGADV